MGSKHLSILGVSAVIYTWPLENAGLLHLVSFTRQVSTDLAPKMASRSRKRSKELHVRNDRDKESPSSSVASERDAQRGRDNDYAGHTWIHGNTARDSRSSNDAFWGMFCRKPGTPTVNRFQQLLVTGVVLGTILAIIYIPTWTGSRDSSLRLFELASDEYTETMQIWVRQRVALAIFCLLVLVVGYVYLEYRDGVFVQPHPAVWRILHGLSLVYLLCLVLLLCLHNEDGRLVFQTLNPGAGSSKYRPFAGTLVQDCSLNLRTLKRQLTSIWFIAHVLGWFFKMCIFRSWMFCLVLAVFFEFSELSLQWVIPEFRECWWDSIFIDSILSNGMGMLLGSAALIIFGANVFDWLGEYATNETVLIKLTPFSGDSKTGFFRTPRDLVLTLVLWIVALLFEINAFLLMTALDIPAHNPTNFIRLIVLGLLAFPAVAEFYDEMRTKPPRIGSNCLLFAIIVFVELLVSIKYGVERYHSTAIPMDVAILWFLCLGFFGLWSYCHFTFNLNQEAEKRALLSRKRSCWCSGIAKFCAVVPSQASCIPLLFLAVHYFYGNNEAPDAVHP